MRFKDPITGDPLTLTEWISWRIQAVIRRLWFLVSFTILTLLVWSTNDPTVLLWWNLAASYLAIFIESVVGLAMFGQTRRDAVILRHIQQQTSHIERLTEQIRSLEEKQSRTIPDAGPKQQ